VPRRFKYTHVLTVLVALLVASPAMADSASVDAVQDAGNGNLSVTYTVSSTAGDPAQFISPAWNAYLAEDHSTRACNPAWANYLRDVAPFQEQAGTVTRTVTFRPFFPRQIKLCVYLNNTNGHRAIVEQVVAIPAGYGVQRSSGYNCEHFSRYSAQDYYWLYPGDPSDLDADNDGAACEQNSGAAPGPQIPPEPTPAPPIDTCNDGIDSDGDAKIDLGDLEYGSAPGPSRSCDQVHTSCLDLIDNDRDGKTDRADADVNGGSGVLAATRCDQIKPAARVAPVAPDPTSRPVRLLCNKFVGRRGRNVAYRTKAPRKCAVWRRTWAHYQALTFIQATWTGWGESTARAHVTITGNSGFRARARIKAYRLRRDCTGDYQVYTRVALLRGGKRSKTFAFKPDTCAN
jgi:hypothetical protein